MSKFAANPVYSLKLQYTPPATKSTVLTVYTEKIQSLNKEDVKNGRHETAFNGGVQDSNGRNAKQYLFSA